ncbi:hypothetical protein ACSVDA_10840 [Cytobacillus sp. Hm23]
METVFILSYGCSLDHSNIDFLLNDRLMPFKKFYNNVNKNISSNPEIKLIYDVFDVHSERHTENKYFLEEFYISKTQLASFEHSLIKLKGNHIRCRPNTRGHIYTYINGKEYTGRVFVTSEHKKHLIFLDDESMDNAELRQKLHLLPEQLQSLVFSNDFEYKDIESIFTEWIQILIERLIK